MKHLAQKLAKLQCFDKIKTICPIDSGLSAHSFKVQTQQGHYFAKYIGENGNSTIERQCNLIAAEQGLTAKVFYFNEQWLISDFIQGCELGNSSLCLDDKLRTAIGLMVKFQQQVIDLPPLNIKQTIVDLLNPLYYLPEQHRLLRKIAQYFALNIQVEANYACHGDVNFSNVLLAKHRSSNNKGKNHSTHGYNNKSYLVDFECACKADIEFDLAMLLAINNLDKSYHQAVFYLYEKFLSVYNKVKINTNLVTCYLPFCMLINGLWFFNKYKQNGDATCLDLAQKQFYLFDNEAIFDIKLSEKMR